MKKEFCLIAALIFASVSAMAQKPSMYPEAPEKWSKPVPIKAISEDDSIGRADSPTVTADGKTLYFGAWSGVTHLTDTGWAKPVRVPILFENLGENPVISPNGKRLFFTWWTNGWHLFYSDWDSTTNDWGPVIDPGAPLNNPQYGWGTAWGCAPYAGCMPDDSTLIYTLCNETFISHWHAATATWDTAVSWPYIFPNSSWDGLRLAPGAGIAVTPNRQKVYQSQWHEDTTREGKAYANYDLTVTYRDTSIERGYGNPNVLNISLMSDSLYFAGIDSGRYEGYPSITADGKTLFFEADYEGEFTIYESHLFIDENGDTVTGVVNNPQFILPSRFELYPSYPNPFNPTTNIDYFVPIRSHIQIYVYDAIGRRIKTLYDGVQAAGKHHLTFDSIGLSSGVYFFLFDTPQGVLTSKITLIK